ncbi:MAG: MerR family transcriptional regulator [Alphaproteobacteria bacterium]
MAQMTRLQGFPIGELARRTNVKIETIRYYERIDLMPKPDRTPGGNRQYNHDQLKRLSFIKRSRELGFSIAEIRQLLGMVDQHEFTCAEVHAVTLTQLDAVQQKIADLQRVEEVLADMASRCSRGDVPGCPIVDALFGEGQGAFS